jgi:chemotaxis protein histidine kinase CheA
MDESGNIFYDELMSKLECMEDALIDVQNGVYDSENINEIFRSIHTIKGTADLLGMIEVVSITHKAEDVLDEVRSNNIRLDDSLCSLLLDLKNLLVILIDQILNFVELDSDMKNLLFDFEKELLVYIPIKEEKKTILVVEDSSLIRESIKYIMQDQNIKYNIILSDSGDDGLQKIKENNIDLLICDISTPYFDGIDMIKEIRKGDTFKTLPIVLLSTKMSDEMVNLGKDISAKAWLLKPFTKNKLLILIEKIF